MIEMGRIRALALLAVASVGLMVGHWLTYLNLAPSHGARSALLGITGHSYLDKILAFGPALALMASLYWIASGALRTRYRWPSLTGTAVALAMIQTIGFAGQEVLERLLSGAPLQDLGSVLPLGIPLQLFAAALGALLVNALHKAGRKLGALLNGPQARPSTPVRPVVRSISFVSAVPNGGLRSRGPPAPSS